MRDSGVLHTLLGLDDREASYYRTAAGAEIDLVLDLPGTERWPIEGKRGLVPKPGRGFHQARADLCPQRTFLVYGGEEHFGSGDGIEQISPGQLMALLQASA